MSRRDARRELASLAARQAGYFTAAQAKEIGYSYQAQAYHVDVGNWLRIDRALFRLPGWPGGPHDSLVRWTLWGAGEAVASHDTALTVHDLGNANPARIHLTVPTTFGGRSDDHLVLRRSDLPTTDVEDREGFRVTTAIRTLFDVASEGPAQSDFDDAIADALANGLVSRRGLLRRADEFGPVAALAIERALIRDR